MFQHYTFINENKMKHKHKIYGKYDHLCTIWKKKKKKFNSLLSVHKIQGVHLQWPQAPQLHVEIKWQAASKSIFLPIYIEKWETVTIMT